VLAEQQCQENYDQGCDVQCCSNDVDATETVLRPANLPLINAPNVEDTRLLVLFCRSEVIPVVLLAYMRCSSATATAIAAWSRCAAVAAVAGEDAECIPSCKPLYKQQHSSRTTSSLPCHRGWQHPSAAATLQQQAASTSTA
jgi:hypothetical protein